MSHDRSKCPNGCAFEDHYIGKLRLWWTDSSAHENNQFAVWLGMNIVLKCDSELEASDELHRAIEGNPSERLKAKLVGAMLDQEEG